MNKLNKAKKIDSNFRKVLSRTSLNSNDSKASSQSKSCKSNNSKSQSQISGSGSKMSPLEVEINSLRDQVENLKAVIQNLERDTEKKDQHLGKLIRSREKLLKEVQNQKQSNEALLRQLEEERKHYFREKEMYCQEMSEFKELKKTMSMSTLSGHKSNNKDSCENASCKKNMANAKESLSQTLEANYNLSLKFLKIKKSKSVLKEQMKKSHYEQQKVVNDLKLKIEMLASEIDEIVDSKFNIPISASNKKYLQLVKNNSTLVYENLVLQTEIDRVNFEFDKLKIHYTKSETNHRLKHNNIMKTESEFIHPLPRPQINKFRHQPLQKSPSMFPVLQIEHRQESRKKVTILEDKPQKHERERKKHAESPKRPQKAVEEPRRKQTFADKNPNQMSTIKKEAKKDPCRHSSTNLDSKSSSKRMLNDRYGSNVKLDHFSSHKLLHK